MNMSLVLMNYTNFSIGKMSGISLEENRCTRNKHSHRQGCNGSPHASVKKISIKYVMLDTLHPKLFVMMDTIHPKIFVSLDFSLYHPLFSRFIGLLSL